MSGLLSRPRPKQRPRSPLLRERPGCPGKKPVGASASPRPGPASSPPPPGRRRSPYPQDVVAFRAPAWDLDALRGAHGGGRSGRPGRAPRCSPPPRVPPSPLLRVALGTWHSQPQESRAALPAGRSSPRQPGPLRRRRQRHLPRATGRGLSPGGRAGVEGGERPIRAREKAEIRFIQSLHLTTGPWA